MTTLTAFSTRDGRSGRSSSVYLDAANDTNSPGATSNATETLSTLGQLFTSPTYDIRQLYFDFDTSSIGTLATIDSVTLSFGYVSKSGSSFIMEARLKTWGTNYPVVDFTPGTSLAALTLLASYDIAGGVPATGNYMDFTSAGGFASNINRTGTTSLMLHSNQQRLQVAPLQNDVLTVYMREDTGSLDPKLTVVYHTDATQIGTAFSNPTTLSQAFVSRPHLSSTLRG